MNEPVEYLSVCSGIDAATVAWEPLGWKPVGFAEIEPYPAAVLHQRYGCGRARFMPEPDATDDAEEKKARLAAFQSMANIPLIGEPQTPNFGDITQYAKFPDLRFSVLIGGTPCQSFSVAGLREGLRDPRGNLALVYLAIAERYRPRWIVWENVPGVLSSDGGRCFGSFLGGLEKLGYGWAYRTLDAQYFGVAQQRRRVFVVGYAGDWRRAAAALFEPESVRWNTAPRRRTRPQVAADSAPHPGGSRVAGTISGSYHKGHGRTGGANGGIANGQLVPAAELSLCLTAKTQGRQDAETETMVAHIPEIAGTLTAGGETKASKGKRSGSDRDTLVGTIAASYPDNYGPQGDQLVVSALTTSPYGDGIGDEQKLVPAVAHTLTDKDRGATPCETLVPVAPSLIRDNEVARLRRALAGIPVMPIAPIPKPVPQQGPLAAMPFDPAQITSPVNRSNPTPGVPAPTLVAHEKAPCVAFGFQQRIGRNGRGATGELVHALTSEAGEDGRGDDGRGYSRPPNVTEEISPTLDTAKPVCVTIHGSDKRVKAGATQTEVAGALRTAPPGEIQNSSTTVAVQSAGVRRLTARECERLQGFPDDYTLVERFPGHPYRTGEDLAESIAYLMAAGHSEEDAIRLAHTPDGPRYKAIGNSMAVPVIRFLGERIVAVEEIAG